MARPGPGKCFGPLGAVIGYSLLAGGVLTVILLPARTDPDDTPAGDWWGANAWGSNARDRRIYGVGHRLVGPGHLDAMALADVVSPFAPIDPLGHLRDRTPMYSNVLPNRAESWLQLAL